MTNLTDEQNNWIKNEFNPQSPSDLEKLKEIITSLPPAGMDIGIDANSKITEEIIKSSTFIISDADNINSGILGIKGCIIQLNFVESKYICIISLHSLEEIIRKEFKISNVVVKN